MVDYGDIAAALARFGLIARGGFHPGPTDALDAASLVLVGNAGPAMWRVFQTQAPDGRDPLNRWTRRVLEGVAAGLGARVVFPFGGPPYHPFQRWAMRAEAVHVSPIKVLIHPDFGLWHAYRGALLFPERIDLPAPDPRRSPCESCVGQPCLSACPVDAFAAGAYDVAACRDHIGAQDGRDCFGLGCAARRACPVGRDLAYLPEQAEFHMAAFSSAATP